MTEVLLSGLKIGESARWHDGRLWLSIWGARQVLAVGLDGGADLHPGAGEAPGFVALITPDGLVRRVAEGLGFPNGWRSPRRPDADRLGVVRGHLTAFDIGPDGSLSNGASGRAARRRRRPGHRGSGVDAGWTEAGPACLRVAEGGQVLEGPHHPRPGRPRRPPLNHRPGRARLTGREVNQGRQSANRGSPGVSRAIGRQSARWVTSGVRTRRHLSGSTEGRRHRPL